MKKIIIGTIVLLLIAAAGGGGYYLLSQKKKGEILNEFSKGGEYSSLGWEVHLPEFHSHQIKGGGNPYVDFGDQEISIFFGGKEVAELEQGRLMAHPKKEKTVSLIFDQVAQGKITYHGLSFELKNPAFLTGIHVSKIQTKPAEVNIQMVSGRGRSRVTLEDLNLSISEYQEFIPDQVNLDISTIQIDQQTKKGEEQIILKDIHTRFDSHPQGEIRNLVYSIHLGEVSGKIEGNKITGKPLRMEFFGLINNIKIAAIQEIVKKIQAQLNKDVIVDLSVELLKTLQPVLQKFVVQWDGLEVIDSQGNKKVSISPFSIYQESREDLVGFTSIAGGELNQITVHGKKLDFGLKDLSFKGSLVYKGKTLKDYYRSYYDNLFNLLTLGKKTLPIPAVIGSFYLDAISRYPNLMDFELKLERLEINPGKPLEGVYTNNFLTAKIHDQGFEYILGTKMNQKVKGPLKEIKNAQIEFKLGGEHPWSYIQEQMSKVDSNNEEQMKQFVFDLLKHRYGYFMGVKADAGDMGFLLDTYLGAKIDMSQTVLTEEEKVSYERVIKKLGDYFVRQGVIIFNFKIGKLSSLKAVMEKIKQGSSSTLALLGAYVKIDEAKDTLEMEYTYKEGQSLLNGVPNENLGKIIEQLKYKLLPFSKPMPVTPQNNQPVPVPP